MFSSLSWKQGRAGQQRLRIPTLTLTQMILTVMIPILILALTARHVSSCEADWIDRMESNLEQQESEQQEAQYSAQCAVRYGAVHLTTVT